MDIPRDPLESSETTIHKKSVPKNFILVAVLLVALATLWFLLTQKYTVNNHSNELLHSELPLASSTRAVIEKESLPKERKVGSLSYEKPTRGGVDYPYIIFSHDGSRTAWHKKDGDEYHILTSDGAIFGPYFGFPSLDFSNNGTLAFHVDELKKKSVKYVVGEKETLFRYQPLSLDILFSDDGKHFIYGGIVTADEEHQKWESLIIKDRSEFRKDGFVREYAISPQGDRWAAVMQKTNKSYVEDMTVITDDGKEFFYGDDNPLTDYSVGQLAFNPVTNELAYVVTVDWALKDSVEVTDMGHVIDATREDVDEFGTESFVVSGNTKSRIYKGHISYLEFSENGILTYVVTESTKGRLNDYRPVQSFVVVNGSEKEKHAMEIYDEGSSEVAVSPDGVHVAYIYSNTFILDGEKISELSPIEPEVLRNASTVFIENGKLAYVSWETRENKKYISLHIRDVNTKQEDIWRIPFVSGDIRTVRFYFSKDNRVAARLWRRDGSVIFVRDRDGKEWHTKIYDHIYGPVLFEEDDLISFGVFHKGDILWVTDSPKRETKKTQKF